MRAGVSAMLLVAAVIAVASLGGSGDQQSALLSSSGQHLDWSAFDQQLHNDWVAKAKANKKGMSSAAMALRERKEEDERRMLAQKRLEVKKVAEEKEMEHLERNIELEASSQLAAHNTQLSDAIVQSAPQLQPQVVFSGHFNPGYDAKSAGEAAAELAAWGPSSNAQWARVLAQQRQDSMLAAQNQPYRQVTYNPIPQQRTAAMRVGPGATGGDALHEAWVAENQLRDKANTEDLAVVKVAAMQAAAHPSDGRKEDSLTQVLAKYLLTSPEAVHKAAKKAAPVPVGHVKMTSALAGVPLSVLAKIVPVVAGGREPSTTDEARVKKLALEAKLAHEQAQNAILKEKLKEEQLQAAEAMMAQAQPQAAVMLSPTAVANAVAAAVEKEKSVANAALDFKQAASKAAVNFKQAAQVQAKYLLTSTEAVPVVHAKSTVEQSKWASVMKMEKQERRQTPALVAGPMRCCDDSCETISSHCNAPHAIPLQPAVAFGVHKATTAHPTSAQTTSVSGAVPGDATEKQLVQFLTSGTPEQKHQAAGLLYAETETHEGFHGTSKVAAVTKPVVQEHQALVKPVEEVMIKGIRRCCDSSCNYVNTVCPNTGALDHFAVDEYADGKGPSQSQLSQWLMSGTQVQKDEAAAVFFGMSHGLVAKEKKRLAKKADSIRAIEAPPAPVHATQQAQQVQSADADEASGGGHSDTLMGTEASSEGARASVGGGDGHSQSVMQVGQVASEAESIVGDLAAEGH